MSASRRLSWLYNALWLAGVFLFSQTVFGFVSIPSESMQPTLNPGDYLFVNRVAYGVHVPLTTDKELGRWGSPQRGDIIIFNSPDAAQKGEAMFIKRVVAVAGDSVEVIDDRAVVNGKMLSYQPSPGGAEAEDLEGVQHAVIRGPGPLAQHAKLVVPPGQVFVMGDHRNASADSRMWGTLPVERIRGKAIYRVFGGAGSTSFTMLR